MQFNYEYTIQECALNLGLALLATSPNGICAIFFGDDAEVLTNDLQNRFPQMQFTKTNHTLTPIIKKLNDLIQTSVSKFDLPLDLKGTPFQQRVWKALTKIPAGKTATYTDIAQQIDTSTAVRAVANACGANPLAIIIPCHRVIRSDGNLSGYRWGIERKRILLNRELSKNINSG
jgi:AraC family transcriptional regulator of adaptative response/methylated-DNA-[protein]-cysteine methyltransferase